MKKLLLVLLSACLFPACSTKDDPAPGPEKEQPVTLAQKHWIPNWVSDTLCCIIPGGGGAKDTLFSYEVKDTSLVLYKGKRYYIWTAANPFTPNAKTYNNCYISTRPLDPGSALAGHILFTVEPGVFRSDYTGKPEGQDQAIEDRGLYTFPAPPFPEGIKSFSTKYRDR